MQSDRVHQTAGCLSLALGASIVVAGRNRRRFFFHELLRPGVVDEGFETHERAPSPVSAKALHRKQLRVATVRCTSDG
jgi:hypothetical protein